MATAEQRASSLSEANRIKKQRIILRAEVFNLSTVQGAHLLADAIEAMPDWLEGQDVWELLRWPRRSGDVTADWMLRSLGVTRKPKLRELSGRQCILLAERLREFRASVKDAA